jgi:hypothetical protein
MLRFVFSYVLMMCIQLSYLEKKGRSYTVMVLYCMTTDLAHVLSMPTIIYYTAILLSNDPVIGRLSAYIILHVHDDVLKSLGCLSVVAALPSLRLPNNFMAYIPNHALAGLRNYRYKGVDKCVFLINHMVNR